MNSIVAGYRPQGALKVLRQSSPGDPMPPIGLIAGWGRFPIEVAEALVQSNRRVACVAIRGHADETLESICDHVVWSGVGKLGGHLRYFRRCGVQEVTMAGKLFKHRILYDGSLWLRHLPDLTCLRTFGPYLFGRQKDARDDQLLGAVVDAYDRRDFQICAAVDLAPELLVKPTHNDLHQVPADLRRDVQSGWHIAKTMGNLDIGQTITVKDNTVLAVEAIEGTDACIERTGQLCRRGGWVLVKVSKPEQDMRFDVPTIGPQTVQQVADAGGRAIVIEAGKTIVVDAKQTEQLARQAGVEIVALSDDSLSIDPKGVDQTTADRTNADQRAALMKRHAA